MKLFPDPQRQGDIHFLFAKSWPYLLRIKIVLALFGLGLTAQLFINFWLGLAFLAFATGLTLIKGYSARPSVRGPEDWSQVTPDEYQKIQLKQKQLQQWDLDCFDITNPLGVACFAGCALGCAAVWFHFVMQGNEVLAGYWAWDSAVVFAPHWFVGVRDFLKKDRLIIKVKLLEGMMRFLSAPSDVQVLPMLATRRTKEGKKVPTDARLMLRFFPAPKEFLGLQVQISMNTVQGTDYPYLYCVLIAKSSRFFHDMKDHIRNPPRGLTLEHKSENDVTVLVIRQRTTRTSGYHTNRRAAEYVLKSAVDITRQLLAKQ